MPSPPVDSSSFPGKINPSNSAVLGHLNQDWLSSPQPWRLCSFCKSFFFKKIKHWTRLIVFQIWILSLHQKSKPRHPICVDSSLFCMLPTTNTNAYRLHSCAHMCAWTYTVANKRLNKCMWIVLMTPNALWIDPPIMTVFAEWKLQECTLTVVFLL